MIRLAYELLTIQSFLTAGEKEVRAWTIPAGASAWEAAGAIHSDIQKGFIRAEVMQYKDLVDLGSEKDVKAAGKMPKRVRVRSCKYLNNGVEQDHRRVKQRIEPMLGFKRFSIRRR